MASTPRRWSCCLTRALNSRPRLWVPNPSGKCFVVTLPADQNRTPLLRSRGSETRYGYWFFTRESPQESQVRGREIRHVREDRIDIRRSHAEPFGHGRGILIDRSGRNHRPALIGVIRTAERE